MIERRPFNELAGADHGWLKATHHFSFGNTPTLREWAGARCASGLGTSNLPWREPAPDRR